MIRLRKLQEKDAPFMIEWMHDSEIQKCFQKDMNSMTLEEVEEFCRMAVQPDCVREGGDLHYAIVNDCEDEYLGTISLKNISLKNASAEYAISTRKCVHGKGVAKEATRLILQKGFEELHLHRIYLNVLSDNICAVKFYEKVGFQYEGEFMEHINMKGRWESLKWFRMLEREFTNIYSGGGGIVFRLCLKCVGCQERMVA